MENGVKNEEKLKKLLTKICIDLKINNYKEEINSYLNRVKNRNKCL